MERRKRHVKWIAIILFSVLALVSLSTCGLVLSYQRRLEQARAAYDQPTVFIGDPASGSLVRSGSYLSVSVTGVGQIPITRVELWANGGLLEARDSESSEGASPFNAYFELLVPEGPSLLLARAINVEGIVGQSLPVAIVGQPASPSEEEFVEVTLAEGETLDDTAALYGTDPETLRELNPELGPEGPGAGSVLVVPLRPDQEEEEDEPAPSTGPATAPGPPSTSSLSVPGVPPLQAIQPSPGMTSTLPLPLVVGSIIPTLVSPSFEAPAAPSDLAGQVDNCTVRLRWNDNARNELRNEVWMAGLGSSAQLVASLQPAGGGPAWVEFSAPHPGFLSFWVEAANAVGSQPSNMVWVSVAPECRGSSAAQLQVDVLDVIVGGGYDKAYCYVSFEGAPEVRMPQDDSAFIGVQGGRGDVSSEVMGGGTYVIPIPIDGVVDLEGECWAWSGNELSELGTFAASYARSTWDGLRRPLEGPAYEIGLAVQPMGGEMILIAYGNEDPTIPAPVGVTEIMLLPMPPTFTTSQQYENWFAQRLLLWAWSGPQKITGFTIFLNGVPYKSIQGAGVRILPVTLPTIYDKQIRWQVAADVGSARSPLSKPFVYDLPKSNAYAVVTLDSIYWVYLSDSAFGECDRAEVYGWFVLMVEDSSGKETYVKKYCNPGNWHFVECGHTVYVDKSAAWSVCPFSQPGVHELVVPFDKDSKGLTIDLVVFFYDHDVFSKDDKIATYVITYNFSSLQHAQSVLGCGKQFQELNSSDDGSSSLNYTLTIYPNSCADQPGTRSPSAP